MLNRIANWWRDQRQWRQTHVRTFGEVSVVDSDGVTLFQRRLIRAIGEVIPPSAFRRESNDEIGIFFVAPVPGTKMELFVYANGAHVSNTPKTSILSGDYWPFEEWDYRTPEELIAAVVEDIKNAV